MDVFDVLALIGVLLAIYCYARVQWQRDYAKRMGYSAFNLLGSLLFGISLSTHWDMPLFIVTCVWGVISLYGIYRCSKYMSRSKLIETRLHKIKRP